MNTERFVDRLKQYTERYTQSQLTTAFLVFLLVWIASLLYVAREWRLTDSGLPLLIGGAAILLILLHLISLQWPELFRSLLPSAEITDTEDDQMQQLTDLQSQFQDDDTERVIPGIILIAWICSFCALLYFFGFYLVLPVFIFATIWYLRRNVKEAAIATLVLVLFIFVGFGLLLDLQLWEGALLR